MQRFLLLAALLLMALACAGTATEEPTPAPPAAPSASPAPAASPVPAASPPPAALPEPPEPPPAPSILPADADPLAAFLADCATTFTERNTWTDETVDECAFIALDPLPEPDLFSCVEEGQTCMTGCSTPCTDCQTTCAAACTDCKSACGGDEVCLQTCAQARQDCRTACLDALQTCTGPVCGEVVSDCRKQGELTKRRECPRCDEITACILRSYKDGTFASAPCRKTVPAAEACYTWCQPG